MDRLLDVDEVRALLNIGRTRTYELIATGELRSLKIGSLRRVPESALAQFIAERIADAGFSEVRHGVTDDTPREAMTGTEAA
jgi:excisionase family DNA binding protein